MKLHVINSYAVAFISMFLFSSECGNSKQGRSFHEGTWKDLSGLDGCGWVIEFNNQGVSEKISPVNYPEFGVKPVDGMSIRVRFEIDPGPNICMAATPARLLEVK